MNYLGWGKRFIFILIYIRHKVLFIFKFTVNKFIKNTMDTNFFNPEDAARAIMTKSFLKSRGIVHI